MEELFDLCSPEGVPTGQTVARSRAHAEGLWHRSAHLWLTDGRGHLLLQQRHPGKQSDPGRWDIAVAGHLSAGQSPLEAIVREAAEELGLALDPTTLSYLGAWPKEYREPGFFDREWQHVFAGRWTGNLDDLVLQAEEVVAVRWIDQEVYRRAVAAGDPTYVDRRDDWAPFGAWVAGAGR